MVVWHCPCKSRSPPGALYLKTLTGNGGGFFLLLCVSQTRTATGHRQGLYTENPASSDAGFFLLCVSQTRAATGHRQGLYPKNPHLTMRVFSLLLCVSQTRAATGHRQGLYTENPASSDAGFFLQCVSQTRAATGHRQGFILRTRI